MRALNVILYSCIVPLLCACAANPESGSGKCAGRAGNQILVTFDKPGNVNLDEGIRYYPECPDPDVKLDVYYPDLPWGNYEQCKVPCLIAIHGGGWSMGNEKKFAMMAAYMASKGYVVACISYRLWPEYDWDCALFGAKRALAWLKKNASRYFGDPEKIGVVGGSSGGVMSVQLAATTGTFWSSDFFEGIDDSVQACVAMAAGCDMTNPRRFGRMFGNDHKKAARYSPYTYLNPSMPPVLLLHAKNDPAVTSNESRMMKSALDKLGVKCEAVYYDSNDHAFWNVKPNDPFRLRSWNDAVAFFDKILKKK